MESTGIRSLNVEKLLVFILLFLLLFPFEELFLLGEDPSFVLGLFVPGREIDFLLMRLRLYNYHHS